MLLSKNDLKVLRMAAKAKTEHVPTDKYDYQVHPAAEAFPLDIASAKFDALVEDIKANGLRESVVLDSEGRLIDGRHRLAACKRLGIEPKITTYEGDAVAYVISTNLHRRHLTDEQRVAAAAMLANLSKGQTTATTDDATTQEAAAKLFGVSSRAIRMAKAAAEKAPEVLPLMRDGKIAVRMAERIVTLPPKDRNMYLSKLTEATDAESLKATRKAVDKTYAKVAAADAEKKLAEREKKFREDAAKLGLTVVASASTSPSWDAAWSEPIEMLTALGTTDFAKLLRDAPLSVEQRRELDGLIAKARAVLAAVEPVEESGEQMAA